MLFAKYCYAMTQRQPLHEWEPPTVGPGTNRTTNQPTQPERSLDAPSEHSAPSTRRVLLTLHRHVERRRRATMHTYIRTDGWTGAHRIEESERAKAAEAGRHASRLCRSSSTPFAPHFLFCARPVCRKRKGERKEKGESKDERRERERASQQTPQTSVLALCSQGQGCHRWESTASGSFRTAKPYNNQKRKREKQRMNGGIGGLDTAARKISDFFPSELQTNPSTWSRKGRARCIAAKVFFASREAGDGANRRALRLAECL